MLVFGMPSEQGGCRTKKKKKRVRNGAACLGCAEHSSAARYHKDNLNGYLFYTVNCSGHLVFCTA